MGLCMKAGKMKSGGFQVEEAVKLGRAWLVIIADDASDNTVKKYENMCSFYEVPVFRYGAKEELGRAIGKEERSVVAVCDEGFSKSLTAYLSKTTEER
ncbi:MAG: ribosomal L7Ae/L30e/S12e/Gadd45 family protein [Lachnospiraceae bacterium]|nr:ribosomal L7Ae/L30e/S12e/Gadd45 family protein [Lachnospiraceae bacterium]